MSQGGPEAAGIKVGGAEAGQSVGSARRVFHELHPTQSTHRAPSHATAQDRTSQPPPTHKDFRSARICDACPPTFPTSLAAACTPHTKSRRPLTLPAPASRLYCAAHRRGPAGGLHAEPLCGRGGAAGEGCQGGFESVRASEKGGYLMGYPAPFFFSRLTSCENMIFSHGFSPCARMRATLRPCLTPCPTSLLT